ncbi:MAG: DUF6597 domain-containing transcriptional factor [Burkholderiales bacterium]
MGALPRWLQAGGASIHQCSNRNMAHSKLLLKPSSALGPFIESFWWSNSVKGSISSREHVLPTGQMHLVFRLSGPPLRLFNSNDDLEGKTTLDPVVGGARSSFYAKEIGASVVSIGAQLRPGAAQALFGVSAAELAERHTSLCDLWGTHGRSALDQICSVKGPLQQLTKLDSLLSARLRPATGLHATVAHVVFHPTSRGVTYDDS